MPDVPRRLHGVPWPVVVTDALQFFVPTRVAGQGSKVGIPTRGRTRSGGQKVVMKEQSEYVAPFRADVTHAAVVAARRERWQRLEGRVRLSCVFVIRRPAKPKYPYPPTPDMDKAVRAVCDALTQAEYVWRDDSQVCEYGEMRMLYEGDDGFDTPGVAVTVEDASDVEGSPTTWVFDNGVFRAAEYEPPKFI